MVVRILKENIFYFENREEVIGGWNKDIFRRVSRVCFFWVLRKILVGVFFLDEVVNLER